MSENMFSVKVCSKTETNIVSLLLTFLSDIWNSFLPENVGIKSSGTLTRKWKYVFFPDFLGDKWGCFILNLNENDLPKVGLNGY